MKARAAAVALLLAAPSAQLLGGGVASAAPGGRVVAVDLATGDIGSIGSRLTVLDVRTGKVISMTAQPGPGDGSEFFLDRPAPLPAAGPDYPNDGSEFRSTR